MFGRIPTVEERLKTSDVHWEMTEKGILENYQKKYWQAALVEICNTLQHQLGVSEYTISVT